MTTALWIAVAGIITGPTVAVLLSRGMDRKKQADNEQEQNISLARLEEKVDAIPAKMNGQIAKALEKHAELWHPKPGQTNPRMATYNGDILE
jgi:hypothetical protein